MFKIGAGAVFGRCRSKPLQLQRPITLNPFFLLLTQTLAKSPYYYSQKIMEGEKIRKNDLQRG